MNKLTQKQEAFCLAFMETGNATEAYRRAYNAAGMNQRTIEKRASELMQNGEVTGRIAAFRAKAAEQATLSHAWLLQRLMHNAEIALGNKKISITYRPRGKDGEQATPVTVEITDRDGNVANRALELLGKHAGFFKADNEQQKISVEMANEPVNRIDLARRILYLIAEAKREVPAEQTHIPACPTKHH